MAVYFIQHGEDGPIKIGHSNDPRTRRHNFQIGSPVPVRLLAEIEGDGKVERELHARFAALRVRGEWFRADAELLSYIATLGRPAKQEKKRKWQRNEPRPDDFVGGVIWDFGGASNLARAIKRPVSTVHQWKQNRQIPEWHWLAIKDAAVREGIKLPAAESEAA